jgi:hypothetical protein
VLHAAVRAGPAQPHPHLRADDVDDLDVAAVAVQVGPDLVEGALDASGSITVTVWEHC